MLLQYPPFDWIFQNLFFDAVNLGLGLVGFVALYFLSVRRLSRSRALIVSAIFGVLLVVGGFLFFYGPPLAWVGVAILMGMLFFGLVLCGLSESEDPRLEERYQDGF